MPVKIAIIAALPREIAALVRGAKADAALLRRGVWLYRVKDAVVVAAGMGAKRAAVAVEAALAEGGVGILISTGLAGGCAAGVEAGAVLEAHEVVDALTGQRFATAVAAGGRRPVVLATAKTIASVQGKARLVESYGALLVDMEASTVARIAQAEGLEFRAIKGVSDGYDFELSSLAEFAGDRGSFRTGAFALHTALRPWEWGKAVELGRGSSKALAGLDEALRGVLARR